MLYILKILQIVPIGTRTNTATYPLSPGTLFHDFLHGKQLKFPFIINKFIIYYFVLNKV